MITYVQKTVYRVHIMTGAKEFEEKLAERKLSTIERRDKKKAGHIYTFDYRDAGAVRSILSSGEEQSSSASTWQSQGNGVVHHNTGGNSKKGKGASA